MPVYAYKGLDASGKTVTGTREADVAQGAARSSCARTASSSPRCASCRGRRAARPRAGGGGGKRADARGRLRARLFERRRASTEIAHLHPPAGDAAQGRHPAGRGAGRAGRAGRQPQAQAGARRTSQPQVNEGASLADALAQHPKRLRRAVHQHGPRRRDRGQPGRGAAAPGRLPRRAAQAAQQGLSAR